MLPRAMAKTSGSKRTRTPILPAAAAAPPRRDPRRWIYGSLDVVFAAIYAFVFAFLIPNRLPLAAAHLWSLPVLALAIAAGLLVVDVVWLLVRILVSAAFLAGVYGGFGKAAATFALLAAALVVEAV